MQKIFFRATVKKSCNLRRYVLSSIRYEQMKGVTCVKEGIHPKYQVAKVRCACGAEFETKSTKKELRVDICSNCHPFFTGKQKLVDTGGRVDRFKKRFGMDQK